MSVNIELKLTIIRKRRIQADLAQELNLSEGQFSRIVNGRLEADPKLKAKIAKKLGVTVEEIFPVESKGAQAAQE